MRILAIWRLNRRSDIGTGEVRMAAMSSPPPAPVLARFNPAQPGAAGMKAAATGLLVVMAAIFIVARHFEHAYPWVGYVKAFAEAAMVGGLADWFAVTALFRHPLGLPIPHTAIIPLNKDRIGESLGSFVEHNFLTVENVVRKLEQRNLSLSAADWIGNERNAADVARQFGALIPGMLTALDDADVRRLFNRTLATQLQKLDVARLAAAA